MSKEILHLIGSFVSFQTKNDEAVQDVIGDVTSRKGLVTSVLFNLNNDHEICIKEFNDSENFYKLSEIDSLKVAKLDPYAFFENIKSGLIEVEL